MLCVNMLNDFCFLFSANDGNLYVYDRDSNQRTLKVSSDSPLETCHLPANSDI